MISATIIIPTCNRPADLARCLQALTPQLEQHPCEVIVSDDSRTEETRAMLKTLFPAVKIGTGPRSGPGANRNAGARMATGEWLIFIDDDVIPTAGFVGAYVASFASAGDTQILHGLTEATPEKSSLLWEAPEVLALLPCFPSCNFAIRRELFEAAGGFDERYTPAFEDIEFASRLSGQGETCTFVPGAAVHHPLRPLPSARKLAQRWEPRVISALDMGASPSALPLLLTKHVALVIASRFFGTRPSWDNIKAAFIFALEFAWFLVLLPGWLRRHARAERSAFWELQRSLGNTPVRYGL